jgi:hypothetical protein
MSCQTKQTEEKKNEILWDLSNDPSDKWNNI